MNLIKTVFLIINYCSQMFCGDFRLKIIYMQMIFNKFFKYFQLLVMEYLKHKILESLIVLFLILKDQWEEGFNWWVKKIRFCLCKISNFQILQHTFKMNSKSEVAFTLMELEFLHWSLMFWISLLPKFTQGIKEVYSI